MGLQVLEAAVAGAHRALRAQRAAEVALTSLREASHVAKKRVGKEKQDRKCFAVQSISQRIRVEKNHSTRYALSSRTFFSLRFLFAATCFVSTPRGRGAQNAVSALPHCFYNPTLSNNNKNVCRKCSKASSCPTAATQS